MRRLLAFMFVLLMWVLPANADAGFTVAAKGAVLIEAESGRVLFGQNENEMLPMASTTKIMTCLVALENSELDEMVTAGKNAHGVTGTSIYLSEGETLTMEQMLYGLMLRSGNDAAVAIAEHVAGSVDEFCDMMNERAEELGADANFVNPHGLTAEGHEASALGLALIMREGLKNEDFARITSTKEKIIPWEGNEYSRHLQNKNRLLTSYEGAMGGKTGYTSAAGRCLVFSAERDGMTLIGCVLGCSTWFDTAEAMLDYGFENFSMKTLARAGEGAVCDVEGGTQRQVRCGLENDLRYPVRDDESVWIAYEIPPVRAPVRAGDAAGYAVVKNDMGTLMRVPVFFEEKVYENSMESALRRLMELWILTI